MPSDPTFLSSEGTFRGPDATLRDLEGTGCGATTGIPVAVDDLSGSSRDFFAVGAHFHRR